MGRKRAVKREWGGREMQRESGKGERCKERVGRERDVKREWGGREL